MLYYRRKKEPEATNECQRMFDVEKFKHLKVTLNEIHKEKHLDHISDWHWIALNLNTLHDNTHWWINEDKKKKGGYAQCFARDEYERGHHYRYTWKYENPTKIIIKFEYEVTN